MIIFFLTFNRKAYEAWKILLKRKYLEERLMDNRRIWERLFMKSAQFHFTCGKFKQNNSQSIPPNNNKLISLNGRTRLNSVKWYSGFSLFLKTSGSNSNSIWNVPTLVKRFLLVLVPRKCVLKTYCSYHRGLCCINFIGVYVCLRFLLRLPPGGTPI